VGVFSEHSVVFLYIFIFWLCVVD